MSDEQTEPQDRVHVLIFGDILCGVTRDLDYAVEWVRRMDARGYNTARYYNVDVGDTASAEEWAK